MSDSNHFKRIPTEYRQFWVPFKTRDTFLYHLTVKDNWEIIKTIGYLEPRDPAPKYWAGMSAVFMSDPHDPWYEENQARVQRHVKEKEKELLAALDSEDTEKMHMLAKQEIVHQVNQAMRAIMSHRKTKNFYDYQQVNMLLLGIVICFFNRHNIHSPELERLLNNLPTVFNRLYSPGAIVELINDLKSKGLIDSTANYDELAARLPQIVNRSQQS